MEITVERSHEYISIEIIHSEQQRKKLKKKNEENLRYLGDNSESLSHDLSVLERMWHRQMKNQWLNALKIWGKM